MHRLSIRIGNLRMRINSKIDFFFFFFFFLEEHLHRYIRLSFVSRATRHLRVSAFFFPFFVLIHGIFSQFKV
ncbi:hypothetical protein F5B19DRAFT_287251 [Rostrohypoxylon terebratum]|nr:hypothetical protein F5B19DRAFT_287251 [Rostrohypoxylon terebratum]